MNANPPVENHLSSPESRAFSHVDTWIFDLDNTLYPHTSRVWPQIDERITLYVADLFGLDGLSSKALQKYFYHKYGTTLRALIDEYDIDPHDFLDFAHDIDHTDIELNASLGEAIEYPVSVRNILLNGHATHNPMIGKSQESILRNGVDGMRPDQFRDIHSVGIRGPPNPLLRRARIPRETGVRR